MNSSKGKLNNGYRFFISITSLLNDPIKRHKKAQEKPKKLNWFFPVFPSINRTKPNRNRSVWTGFGSVFFLKKLVWLFFYMKTKANRKCSPLPLIASYKLHRISFSSTISPNFFISLILDHKFPCILYV
jgi:hypothetical protein